MKAIITIKQPFASLIAAGLKEYEFRTWRTGYRGEVLIHAGKSVDAEAMKRFAGFGLEYPSGCILAKATLTDCVKVTEDFREELRRKNAPVYAGTTEAANWEGYGFKLENVQRLEPVYVIGMLGLWEYTPADNLSIDP